MKIHELLEAKAKSASEEITLKELVRRFSPQFLGRSGHQLMYRGIKSMPESAGNFEANGNLYPFYIFDVRKDRKPRDTNSELSAIIDDWFEEEFAFSARSQSAFCTGNRTFALTFGLESVAVFPVGKFSYIWTPNSQDLIDEFQDNKNIKQQFYVSDKNGKRVISTDAVHSYLKSLKFTNNNLPAAIKSGNEIMVDCDKYIAIKVGKVGSHGRITPEQLKAELDIIE